MTNENVSDKKLSKCLTPDQFNELIDLYQAQQDAMLTDAQQEWDAQLLALVDLAAALQENEGFSVKFQHWLLLVLCLYCGLAFLIFALRHPHLTDTERLLHWQEVLLMRSVEGR